MVLHPNRIRTTRLPTSCVLATFVVATLVFGCSPPAPAQPATRATRVGVLATGTKEGRAPFVESFRQGLRELGYVEGQNILLEYRYSEQRDDQLPELATELVNLPVDIILASGTPATVAAKQATTTIPIVMPASAADPVRSGFVASLARPGGNITGLTALAVGLAAKRLELLKELVPGLSRAAVFWNPTNPTYEGVFSELDAAAPGLGIALQRIEVKVPEDFEPAFASAVASGAGAMMVPGDPLTTNRPATIAQLSQKYHLPAIMDIREFVTAGGLVTYGVSVTDLYRRSAVYIDKLVKGAKAAELPVEEPSTYDLALNVQAAHGLGLTISEPILNRANEVIQ
jgi:putative tryptophan/tyrosine transport system substrate-binding protein